VREEKKGGVVSSLLWGVLYNSKGLGFDALTKA